MVKKERIGGDLLDSELVMTVRHEPFAVYVKYVDPNGGRQVLYRDGENDGQMLVRQTGLASFLGTMQVAPAGTLALKENRHPITKAGMANLAGGVADEWSELSSAAPDGMTVRRYPSAKFADFRCEAFEVSHEHPGPHVAFHRTRLFLDRATGLPVRVQRYGFPSAVGIDAPLVEDYAYFDLDLKTRLTDRDFDPANPSYGFE